MTPITFLTMAIDDEANYAHDNGIFPPGDPGLDEHIKSQIEAVLQTGVADDYPREADYIGALHPSHSLVVQLDDAKYSRGIFSGGEHKFTKGELRAVWPEVWRAHVSEHRPTTSKVSTKRYKCALPDCGHEYETATNHYGEIYSRCPKCSWKGSTRQHRSVCLDPLPDGMSRPDPWQLIDVRDLPDVPW